jgi:riboflavin synthase
MFTGIVEEVGKITSIKETRGTRRLTVAASHLIKELKKGDSISVSGVCLTAVGITGKSVSFDLAEET